MSYQVQATSVNNESILAISVGDLCPREFQVNVVNLEKCYSETLNPEIFFSPVITPSLLLNSCSISRPCVQ